MWLKSLLELLLLPPVNLLFAVLAGVALIGRAPRFGRWLAGIAAVLLLILAMPAVALTLLGSLEHDLPMTPPAARPPGAIVILGGDVARTGGTQPGFLVGPLSLARVRAGAALQRRTRLPVLITGGRIHRRDPPVAEVMRDSLQQDFGVPVRWVETHALDTWQNARDSAAILHAAGIDSIYLVTDSWHERRALMAFAGTGIAVTAAPTPLDRPPSFRPGEWVPSVSAWVASYYALHEWVGCLWYALP